MQVGIQLPEIERVVGWPEYAAIARLAEDVGFASIWVGDHLLYDKPAGPRGPWECWTVLAGLAAVTDRLLLGPLVTPIGFRNPALLAKMAGTVDEIARGRLVLGLGAGWNEREFSAFDFAFDNRVGRFEEAFTIISELVRHGSVDFSGRYYLASDLHLVPPARPDLPIMIGSSGERMLGIAAPEMDWWNEWWSRFGNSPAGLEPLLTRLDAALIAAGRSPGEVTRSVALLVQMPEGSGRQMGATADTPPIAGTVTEIGDRILGFAEHVDHVQLVVDPITTESIEALAPMVARVHGTPAPRGSP